MTDQFYLKEAFQRERENAAKKKRGRDKDGQSILQRVPESLALDFILHVPYCSSQI